MTARALYLLLGLPALAACTSVPEDSGFDGLQEVLATRLPQRLHWERGGQEDAQAAQAVTALLHEQLTVDTAVQIALLRNAGLQATFEDLGVAQADLVQAGLLANPIFEFEWRFPGHPSRPLEVHVIQDFMNIFTRSLRERVAQGEFEATRLRVAGAVLDLASEVRTAFYEAQAAEQLVELHGSVTAATAAAADAASRLREAGNITELEYENEVAADGEARLALLQAEAERVELREKLTALLGLWGEDTAWKIAGRLPELPADEVAPEGLETLAVSQRLDLQAAAHEIVAVASALDLTETTALIPSLELGLHAEREPEDFTTTGPSIGLPLPLFDQGQARRARDEALLRRSQQRYLALAVQVRSEVRALRGRLLAARARSDYLQSVVLPLRDRIVRQTQLQYNAMQLGVFTLLMARRAEIDAGRDSVGALRDYWLARTALEHAVGGSLAPLPPHTTAEADAPSSHDHGDHP